MGSFTKLTYHIVFSTKYRRRSIHVSVRERLWEYMGGTVRGLKGHLIEIGGVEDHVHLLANLSPTYAVSETIREPQVQCVQMGEWTARHRQEV